MNPKGYELATKALQEAGVNPSSVDPCPEEGQDIDRVTVTVSPDTRTEQVEEVFRVAGLLMDPTKSRSEQIKSLIPVLSWCNTLKNASGTERYMEFEDITVTADTNS